MSAEEGRVREDWGGPDVSDRDMRPKFLEAPTEGEEPAFKPVDGGRRSAVTVKRVRWKPLVAEQVGRETEHGGRGDSTCGGESATRHEEAEVGGMAAGDSPVRHDDGGSGGAVAGEGSVPREDEGAGGVEPAEVLASEEPVPPVDDGSGGAVAVEASESKPSEPVDPPAPAGPSPARTPPMALRLRFRLHVPSPCEEKDQDRSFADSDQHIYCVCDGLTSSARSAEAADRVARSAPALLEMLCEETILERVESLRREILWLREQCKARPASIPGHLTGRARAIMESAVQKSLESACQTTFLAMRLVAEGGAWKVHHVSCGDSGLLVLDERGSIIDRVPVDLQVPPSGVFTANFPSHDPRFAVLALDRPCELVLATDGFFNAMAAEPSFGPAVCAWLDNYERKSAEGRKALEDGLHKRLSERTGDDDITLIWLSLELEGTAEVAAGEDLQEGDPDARGADE